MSALLLSGGIDSLATWRLLKLPPALHYRMGTVPEAREEAAITWAEQEFGSQVTHLNLPLGDAEKDNGYLPQRNGILVLAAAQRYQDIIVAQVAEWAPDKNRRYWRKLARLASQANSGTFQGVSGKITISTPYEHHTKGSLLLEYAHTFGLTAARELALNTWSCYGDNDIHCGKCSGCNQRAAAEHFAFGNTVSNYTDTPMPGPVPAAWQDGLRWVRDNGLITATRQMSARAREVRIYHEWQYLAPLAEGRTVDTTTTRRDTA